MGFCGGSLAAVKMKGKGEEEGEGEGAGDDEEVVRFISIPVDNLSTKVACSVT